jgi:hypothetical protein
MNSRHFSLSTLSTNMATARRAGSVAFAASTQGLTLVHFSSQLEPCLTQENTLHTLYTL